MITDTSSFFLRNLKKKSFDAIRMFPEEERKEKERALRRAEMRQKVAALLPDFAATSLKSSRDMS